MIITRGYPGSGKTTWAEAETGYVRVNRDDLRHTLFKKHSQLTQEEEGQVTKAQRAQVTGLLTAGINVIVDDTNLRLGNARDLADIAAKAGADFSCKDFLVPADVCISNDAMRALAGQRNTGPDVIRRMAERYPMNRWAPVTARVETKPSFTPWDVNLALPGAILTDVDGTVADHTGIRSPYDFTKVHLDRPINHTILAIRALVKAHGVPIIALSGRDDSCYQETMDWLTNWRIEPAALYMRKTGDKRRDDIVKHEIFQTEIRPRYNPLVVFDDRRSVSRMWHEIGLPLLRVGDPDANF